MIGGVEKMIVGQVADRATVVVGGEDAVPERGLVQSLLDQKRANVRAASGGRWI